MLASSRSGHARAPSCSHAEVSGALEDLLGEIFLFHRQQARSLGLTPLQGLVLKSIAKEGSCSPSELADEFGISRPAVSAGMNALEAGGWIVRSRGADDRRGRRTSLTPRARRMIASTLEARQRIFEQALCDMDERTTRELDRHLRELSRSFRRLRETESGALRGMR